MFVAVVPVPREEVPSCVIAVPPAVVEDAVGAAAAALRVDGMKNRISPTLTAAVVVTAIDVTGFAETAEVPISVTVAAIA
jgi:hypothetical protein